MHGEAVAPRKRRGQPRKPIGPRALPAPLEHRWTLLQIAVAHQFTVAALIKAIKRGELDAEKMGEKEWRVSESAYRRWLANCEYRPGEARA